MQFIAWFDRRQYKRVKAVIGNHPMLQTTYKDWLAKTTESRLENPKAIRVDITLEDILAVTNGEAPVDDVIASACMQILLKTGKLKKNVN